METTLKAFGEFGVLAMMLAFLLMSIGLSLRWLGQHAVLPLVKSGITYMERQTEATEKNVESLSALSSLERDIRQTILEMERTHSDDNSNFATVHTNTSIKILAKAIGRIAVACDTNVDDLIREIEMVVMRQKT